MTKPLEKTHPSKTGKFGDPIVFGLSGGFVILFVLLSLINLEGTAEAISTGFTWTAATLGSYFQLLLLLTFFIAIGLALSPAAGAKIGGLDQPELSNFKWLSTCRASVSI